MVHTVLIVDEEQVQRDLLTHCLQNRLGYRIMATATCREALSIFQTENSVKPDIVLMDWPGAIGADLSAGIKALGKHAPIVVLVTYGDYEAGAAALNAGAQDFLTKPVAMERLNVTFRNILLLRDARREVERLKGNNNQDNAHYPASATATESAFPLLDENGNIRRMEEMEADAIRFAMQYYHGRMTEVARRLGIGRSTLYRKLTEFSIRHSEAA